jgi:UDP-2,3-diacylglucosamine pyrophosphatase LpxH
LILNSPPKKTHTIIISDIHLGSFVSRADKTLALLESYSFKKLILLGDIFDDLNFSDLNQDHWKLLAYLGKISKTKKVRWVEGNHDKGLSKIIGPLMGAKIYKNYRWQYKNKKYLAIHGHQFDRFLIDNTFLSYAASFFYNIVQKVDFKNRPFSRLLKRKSKGWLRLSDKVAYSALAYAKRRRVNYIFCGHTHKPMYRIKKGIKYYNSGCWTDNPCTFVTIDEKKIEIKEY